VQRKIGDVGALGETPRVGYVTGHHIDAAKIPKGMGGSQNRGSDASSAAKFAPSEPAAPSWWRDRRQQCRQIEPGGSDKAGEGRSVGNIHHITGRGG
jgi:hypothetical protein